MNNLQTKKRFYYHGTSADNLKSILRDGLVCNNDKIWTVSEDGIYLWDAIKCGEANDIETNEEMQSEGFRMAFESAQIACAIAKDCRCIVLKIELNENDVETDYSSENMEGRGAVVTFKDIPLKAIKEIKISNDLNLLKGYFIAMLMNNEFSGVEFNKLETRIGQAFKNAEIYPEDIEDIVEWETASLPTAKKTKGQVTDINEETARYAAH